MIQIWKIKEQKMNLLKQQQTQDTQETICKVHNLELIAVDLDISNKAQIEFFCGKCLVDKINNAKVTTIEQSKERIQQIKAQYTQYTLQLEVKTKENQARIDYYKNILEQIMDFKRKMDDTLEKMYKQIQQYIFPIQKEKQELQDYEQKLNYFEDIKQLSELYASDLQKSQKLEEDNNFIEEIQRQFELLLNSSEYFQTLDTFKNAKGTIKDIMENNTIELLPLLQTKNDVKTPSLSRICNNHKKEIIMIDMESQNKKIEDRFVCVDCISENPQIKYQTIENINKQWQEYNSESETLLREYKKENQIKKSELFNQIALMRKNYNQKLNEISDKLIFEQFLCSDKTKELKNNIKAISIQTLSDEQLIKELKLLIEKDKEKVISNHSITNLRNKYSIFKKDIEHQLESLKQHDQQDIQQSLDILKGISIERNLILQLSDIISQIQKQAQKDENYKNELNFIKEIEDIVDQTKSYQCQLNLLDSIIKAYQQNHQKIELLKQQIETKAKDQSIKSESLQSQYQNLSNIVNEYKNYLNNNSKQLQKYCNIQQFEDDICKFKEINQKLEIEKNQKEKENKNIKLQLYQMTQENIDLKRQNEQDMTNLIQKAKDEQNKQQQEFNRQFNLINTELKTFKAKLEQIDLDNLEKEKLEKMQIEKIQLYQKALTFSNTFKHGDFQISEGVKLVAEITFGGNWRFCLCEQAIPKSGKIQFAFQIISGSYNMVGIGFRDIMQKNNYLNCYETGTYLISHNGQTYSHHNKDLHNQKLSFRFTNNDIIIIEVCIEHKYIKWSRQNNPQATVQFEIDTSQELYPCVGVSNTNRSKIKIMDKVPT